MKRIASILALSAALHGCASVPMGEPALDSEMKRFGTLPDMSRIYIYRNENMGAAIKMTVTVDGRVIGATAANTYLVTEVPAGSHTIGSDAENLTMLKVNAQPGKNLYVWQEVKMGFGYARSQLHLVSEAEGREGVLETKLAGSL
ncbi:uncharacterized protein DUF2846 [Pseudomonas protegens]|uniref:DUF2846 domain-containing protein n=1 Tax=Pseudomonas TaxID=286 RepID=UPI000F471E6C|nr:MULTISPECIES: DUF2846 domain-containing protein [Pseudomonas]MCS4261670.1 hypothetical protein [Pseudomonas sp. BIGb0176]ROQ51045.1 uncharacterized protein DUF2846 [Pseudomonas protegens]ROQ78512.1 uncharacterized protein DUF2846 [Pseudomonas protegens]